LKEDERPVKSLNDAQVKILMTAAEPYRTMRVRILLALGTGLRLSDIESLSISNIDFENNSITTSSKKTRKSMGSRPVSTAVMRELSKYVCELDPGQEKLFNDNFSYKRWRKLCQKAGLADLKFHDLRKTFGSMLAQNGISTAVTQKLLEHSTPTLTNKAASVVLCALLTAIGIDNDGRRSILGVSVSLSEVEIPLARILKELGSARPQRRKRHEIFHFCKYIFQNALDLFISRGGNL
jgi:site-specific recombinase XerD